MFSRKCRTIRCHSNFEDIEWFNVCEGHWILSLDNIEPFNVPPGYIGRFNVELFNVSQRNVNHFMPLRDIESCYVSEAFSMPLGDIFPFGISRIQIVPFNVFWRRSITQCLPEKLEHSMSLDRHVSSEIQHHSEMRIAMGHPVKVLFSSLLS